MKLIIKIIVISFTLLLNACSVYNTTHSAFTTAKVEAWERGNLAQDDMQLEPDTMRTFVDEHIYFSKEASSGGRGVGGGGCGCN